MNLLTAKIYDPAVAVTKATSALLAMTAFDTTNLRLAVTVPAHGFVRFRMVATVTGATTMPVIYLGVMNGSTVVARCTPTDFPGTASAATQTAPAMIEVVVGGLTPGLTNFDAAYGVEVLVAATAIKYGGPNNAVTNDAWGAFQFEAWDPQPQTANTIISVDASGRVDVGKVAGTAQTARDLGAQLDAAVSSRLATSGYTAPPTAAVNATAVRTELTTELGRVDVATSTRLATAGYTAPDNTSIATLTGRLTSGRATALDNLDATVSSRLAASGYTAPNNALLTTVATYVDTEVAAIKGVVDKLDTAMELDGAVYRFTANALEMAPVGGGGAGLDAAGVRAAVGLASANLDTQLAGLSTFDAAVDTVLADMRLVNSIPVAGSGTPGNPWGPA